MSLETDFAAMEVDDEKRRKRAVDTPGGPRKRQEKPRKVRYSSQRQRMIEIDEVPRTP